jgi:hypothetical protein
MKCLVFVKFLPGGSIPPNEFFQRLNAVWSYVDNPGNQPLETIGESRNSAGKLSKSGICITDYDSIEQLTMDLTIMPGAGISNVEVVPLSEETDLTQITRDALLAMAG